MCSSLTLPQRRAFGAASLVSRIVVECGDTGRSGAPTDRPLPSHFGCLRKVTGFARPGGIAAGRAFATAPRLRKQSAPALPLGAVAAGVRNGEAEHRLALPFRTLKSTCPT